MKKYNFFEKSLAILIGAVSLSMTALIPVCASAASDVYGGAAGLSKEAIESIKKGDSEITYEEDTEDKLENRDLSGTILNGISIGSVDLSGKSFDQAVAAVDDYVDKIASSKIMIGSDEGNSIEVSVKELGVSWDDKEVIADALSLGRDGNIIERYKERKDIENEKRVYPLKLDYDRDKIKEIVESQASLYDVEAVNASLQKSDNGFTVVPGMPGQRVDINGSVGKIVNSMSNFNGGTISVALEIETVEPKASTEDLE